MDYIPTEDLAFYILEEIASKKCVSPVYGNYRDAKEVMENVKSKYALEQDAFDRAWVYLRDRKLIKAARNGNDWIVDLSDEGIKWIDEMKKVVSEREIQKRHHEQIVANSIESNRVSKEANKISESARNDARIALGVAIFAALIAACSLAQSCYQNKQSNPPAPSPASINQSPQSPSGKS